jgi:hypothetical protein
VAIISDEDEEDRASHLKDIVFQVNKISSTASGLVDIITERVSLFNDSDGLLLALYRLSDGAAHRSPIRIKIWTRETGEKVAVDMAGTYAKTRL